jgi:hypothetical protein
MAPRASICAQEAQQGLCLIAREFNCDFHRFTLFDRQLAAVSPSLRPYSELMSAS